ncbi:MAG: ABC transporter permease [Saprospiraceae bacterium]|nr:ABC transporter permease [Saprospiraceae bacterium]
MIPLIAWRNIWRSRTRSLVVIGAIAIGVWAALFMTGFATGMARGYVRSAVDNIVSHLQMHHPQFKEDYDARFMVDTPGAVADRLREMPSIKAVSARAVVNGMASTPKGARGVQIKGINPDEEAGVTTLREKIVEGSYFLPDRRNEVLISVAMADKLHIKMRSKLVLTFQETSGELTTGAFRVAGIFDSGNKPFDETHIFVDHSDMAALLAPGSPTEDVIQEIAIMLHAPKTAATVSDTLQSLFPGLLSETYHQISPDLEMYESQINTVSYIYLGIIMLALVFGIVNTMLMAVLERYREIGMLMAIGMNKIKVFSMIVFEALMLGLIAAPLGMGLGWVSMLYLGRKGINLSAYSESLRLYGLEQIIYFELPPETYWQAGIFVMFTALLASLYPAWKAISLRPVEAIRKI